MPRKWVVLPMTLAALCSRFAPAQAAQVCNNGANPIQASASSLSFGNYSAGASSPTDANGSVTVKCSKTGQILPNLTVALSAGGAGSFNPRKMSSGASKLNYNMYTTSTYTTIWGDGTGGTATQSYAQSQNLNSVTFTNFGQVPASQFVTAGSYTDTITVTVTF